LRHLKRRYGAVLFPPGVVALQSAYLPDTPTGERRSLAEKDPQGLRVSCLVEHYALSGYEGQVWLIQQTMKELKREQAQ